MHRKKRPESELWLWTKIVTIPACLVVYWSLLFIGTAAGNAWTIWAVCASYALLVAWLYSVYRVLHLAAWKRDRAIAEELADQTGPFEPQWEDIGLTEEGFDLPKDWHTGHLSAFNSRAYEKYTREVPAAVTTSLTPEESTRALAYFDENMESHRLREEAPNAGILAPLYARKPNDYSCGEPQLLTHDELYGGRHERTEIAPVQSFFPDHAPELPKADG